MSLRNSTVPAWRPRKRPPGVRPHPVRSRCSALIPPWYSTTGSPVAGTPVADTPAAGTPVVVGHGDDPGDHHDVLINLAPEVPDFATRFQRVAEMITGDGPLREAGRARFRFYRDRGFQIQSHRL